MRRAAGDLDVFTFKAGLLAVAAHDLHFRLEGFEASLESDAVTAEVRLADLRLVGPVEGGVTHRDRYDAQRTAEVEAAMRSEILHTDQHPITRFAGRAAPRDDGWDVTGELTLAGRSAPLAFPLRSAGARYRATFDLRPSQWGIAEYRAMMGTIRLQDRIRIEVALREV
jgi:polyisoprenoid-binding protein YceI